MTVTDDTANKSLWKKITFKFWWWKLQLYCAYLETKNKHARRKYCRKGYHKLHTSSLELWAPPSRSVYIRYLKCAHCNYLFFASRKDKEKYLAIKNRESEGFKENVLCHAKRFLECEVEALYERR